MKKWIIILDKKMDLTSVLIVELLFFFFRKKKKELEKCHVYGGKGDNQYI